MIDFIKVTTSSVGSILSSIAFFNLYLSEPMVDIAASIYFVLYKPLLLEGVVQWKLPLQA